METKSRERISVDLQGLKPALWERSKALGVSPSALVRKTLEQTLGVPAEVEKGAHLRPTSKPSGDRARLCLRMEREGAMAVLAAAKRAGMSPGDYVAGLVAGVPVLLNGGSRSDHIVALTASNACVSNLSRNIYALTSLLTQANVAQARVYRDMLDTLNGDVRRHLELAAGALADLTGRRGHATRRSHRRC